MDGELVVTRRDLIADRVVALRLGPLDGGRLPQWTPGAHIDVAAGPDTWRSYSLCGDPADRGGWRIAVLLEPAGRGGSRFVHESLSVGSRLRYRGPRNQFELVAAPYHLFIAGGIGITPILPMLAATGGEWRLVYGGRTRAAMAFLDELAAYPGRVAVRPQDETGLLDLDAILADQPQGTVVYCCGPAGLLDAMRDRWPADRLRLERFAPVADVPAGEGFDVVLARAGLIVRVGPGQSILAAVTGAGVPVLSSCREGTCGTCETVVLAGEAEHHDVVLSPEDKAAGDVMMICVSRARTPSLTLDL